MDPENNLLSNINNFLKNLNFKQPWQQYLFGSILFCVGSVVLVGNEYNAAQRGEALQDTISNMKVVHVSDKLKPEYEGQVVYITGPLNVESINIPEYGLTVSAVKLKRQVEMYQWVEKVTKVQNTKKYSYTKEWRDELIDSSKFYYRDGHQNPKTFPVETRIQTANVVTVGAFKLSSELKERFTDFVQILSDKLPQKSDVQLVSGQYYHGFDVWNPKIGDCRVTLYSAGHSGEKVTVVGKQMYGTVVQHVTKTGHKFLLLKEGEVGVTDIFRMEYNDIVKIRWVIRFIGFAILFFSLESVLKLLHYTVTRIPILNDYVPKDFGLNTTAYLIVTSFLSLIVVFGSWEWINSYKK